MVDRRQFLSVLTAGLGAAWPAAAAKAVGKLNIVGVEVDVLASEPRSRHRYDAVHDFGDDRGGAAIRIKTDGGVTGWAYSSFGMVRGGPATVANIVKQSCSPILIGQDPAMTRKIRADLWRGLEYHGVRGVAHFAIGAIDIALWDIIGKALQTPVHRLLGAARDRVPAYSMSGWYYENDADLSYYREQVQETFDEGFKAVKIKVGRNDLKDDIRRIELAWKLAGENRRVMVDANQGLNVNDAVRRGRVYQDMGCFWYEEPLPPHRLDGYAELAASLDIRIATGENAYTKYEFLELMRRRGADVLQPDNRRAGGVTEWMEIAAMADGFGLEIASHGGGPTNVHMLCAMPHAIYVETSGLSGQDRHKEKLKMVDGEILAPQSPGIGSELDPDYIAEHRVSD